MKRTNTLSLANIVEEILGEYKIADKLYESRIITAWSEQLGPLSKYTEKLYIKDNVLFVTLSSSVVRNELSMMRSTLIKRLNESAGKDVITTIVFS